ncbi:hypothetical protein LXA43DRAFT_738417 [Ganoderma leucocontextum]|nr:hypothetical protein LXA43DRAFT_738417 [Ganoderma leucocontextum]
MTIPELRDGLNLLVVGTVFASFLIPTSVVLFSFTPVRIWRSPLFILNVLAIILGLTEQILYIYVIINTSAFGGVPTFLVMMIVAMDFLLPVSVQAILLVRLTCVYAPTRNSRMQNIAIYVPVVAFKIARLVNAVYAIRDLAGRMPDSFDVIAAAQLVWSTKYVKVEWFLQLFDDMFVSGLFVHKLSVSVVARKEADIHTGHTGSSSSYSWAERIRTLYYIAVSNFVFPILFNIAEIFVIFYDPNFFHGATVVTVNCYVTIIGVLLATIWAQGSKRGKLGSGSRHHATTVLGSVEFAPQRDIASNAESEMPDDDEDDGPSRSKRGQAPPMRVRERGEAPSGSLRGEKTALFRSVGRSTVTCGTIDEEMAGEKRVSSGSTSSSGATADRELGPICDPEVHGDVAGEDERHLRAPSSRASVHAPEWWARSVEAADRDDRISYAV